MYFNASDYLRNSKLSKCPSVVSYMSVFEIGKTITQAKICHIREFATMIPLTHRTISLLNSVPVQQPTITGISWLPH